MIGITKSRFFNYYLPLAISVVLVVLAGFAYLTLQTARVAYATIALAQTPQATTGTTGSTLALAYASNNTQNDLLIVVAETLDSSTLSIADSVGNSYTPISSSIVFDFGAIRQSAYYAVAKSSGANTVTLTDNGGSGNSKILHIYEYSGIAAISPLDQATSTTTLSCSGNCITTAAVTTTQANELLFAAGGPSGSLGGNTAGSAGNGYSYTIRTDTGLGTDVSGEDVIVSSTYAYSATINFGAPQGYGGLIMGTFKAASTAAPPAHRGLTIENAKVCIGGCTVINPIPAFVNATSGSGYYLTSFNATINATTGNLLYVVVDDNVSGSGCSISTVTISDNASPANTYTQIRQVSQTYDCITEFYAKNITGSASLQITANLSVAKAATMSAMQFSGLDTGNPLDATSTGTGAGATLTSGSFSTTNANEVIIAGASDYMGPSSWTAGSAGSASMGIPSNVTKTTGNATGNSTAEYAIVSSLQNSITASITRGGTPDQGGITVATFKAASGGRTGGGAAKVIIQPR